MGGLIDASFQKAEMGRYQGIVDAFFRNDSNYWRDVYQEDTLDGWIYRQRQSTVLQMAEELALPGQARVLEVGCGAGLTTVALARRGYVVHAIDTVEAMVNLTRQAVLSAAVDSHVKITLSNVLDMSFPAQHFELVVAMGVLPWLQHPKDALAEMGRVVRPGGYVIATTDNQWCLNQMLDPLCFPGLRSTRWRIADLLERLGLRMPSRPRLHRHSVRETDELLFEVGLRKVQGRTLGFGPFTFFKQKLFSNGRSIKLHTRLQALADRQFPGIRLMGTEYVVMARKPQAS